MSAEGSAAGRHAYLGGGAGHDGVTENAAELGALVAAARGGDRQAAETLIAAHLPLLYRIVGRALDGHADVDDVVQETVLRAHRDLPSLRTPASFRSWLVAIAMHQVSSRLRTWQQDRDRSVPLDDAELIADPEAEFADVTLLRVGLSEQRRQAAEAARWLDSDDQELAALWWREVAGELSRAELVRELGVSAAHARVRIQRMRGQLELSRLLVAALEAQPRCPDLAAPAEKWDGTPSPRWRKRFARHLRDCPVCGDVRAAFFPLERLIVGAAVIPLPATASAVGAFVGGTATTGGAVGWLGQLIGAKAVTAAILGAAVSGGVYLALPDDPATPPPPTASAAPSPSAGRTATQSPPPRPARPAPAGTSAAPSRSTPSPKPPALVPLGRVMLRPAEPAGTVVALDGEFLVTATGVPAKVLNAVPGITDQQCVSLRDDDGRWFRHASFRIMLSPEEDKQLFRMDSTFCPHPGTEPGTVRFTSFNYPDRYVVVVDGQLRLDPPQPGPAYVAASTFIVTTE